MNAGLSYRLFSYFWNQLTPLGGVLVQGLRPHLAAVD
jgi:hypothetical protein